MQPSVPAKNNKPRAAKKPPKKITAEYLHNSGLYYLQRYAASSGHFREVMLRKVKTSCRAHPDQEYAQCAELVDALVQKFLSSGLLNDDLYVRGVVGSLRRRGTSTQSILGKLRLKSVDGDTAARHLQEIDEDFADAEQGETAERKAALIFARRKKLGPYAQAGWEEEDGAFQKALAKFARAGFSYEVAAGVLKLGAGEVN